jgi:hypothetical protein
MSSPPLPTVSSTWTVQFTELFPHTTVSLYRLSSGAVVVGAKGALEPISHGQTSRDGGWDAQSNSRYTELRIKKEL